MKQYNLDPRSWRSGRNLVGHLLNIRDWFYVGGAGLIAHAVATRVVKGHWPEYFEIILGL